MKSSWLILGMGALALVAGGMVHWYRQNTPQPTAPAIELEPSHPATSPARNLPETEDPASMVSKEVSGTVPTSSVMELSNESNSMPQDGAESQSSPVARAVATLISSDSSFQLKEEAWEQLRADGQLDQVIEALKQGATENPDSAAYPATLGQAQLRKAGVIAQGGGPLNEMGILGMQADQNFDQALKLDPSNWDAQFFKAAAMSHWPLELNKGDEVIQRLSTLISQQEAMPAKPQFAQTYVVLGDQYQKLGMPEYASATWVLGAQTFPGDPTLQQRIREQRTPSDIAQ